MPRGVVWTSMEAMRKPFIHSSTFYIQIVFGGYENRNRISKSNASDVFCISAKINANCISVSVCATWFKVP